MTKEEEKKNNHSAALRSMFPGLETMPSGKPSATLGKSHPTLRFSAVMPAKRRANAFNLASAFTRYKTVPRGKISDIRWKYLAEEDKRPKPHQPCFTNGCVQRIEELKQLHKKACSRVRASSSWNSAVVTKKEELLTILNDNLLTLEVLKKLSLFSLESFQSEITGLKNEMEMACDRYNLGTIRGRTGMMRLLETLRSGLHSLLDEAVTHYPNYPASSNSQEESLMIKYAQSGINDGRTQEEGEESLTTTDDFQDYPLRQNIDGRGQAMKKRSLSLPKDHVIHTFELANNSTKDHVMIHIFDRGLANKSTTFAGLFRRETHCPPEQLAAFMFAFLALLFGQIWALGNPFADLCKSTSTGKGTQASILSWRQAFSKFLPAIMWSAIFFWTLLWTALLAGSMQHYRGPLFSLLLFSLVYYLASVFANTCFEVSVRYGFVTMPGLLFAGGTLLFVLLIGLAIVVVPHCLRNIREQGKVTLELG